MLLVLLANHVILDVEAFHQAINIASQQVQSGNLATFDIVPKMLILVMAILSHIKIILTVYIKLKSLLRSQI